MSPASMSRVALREVRPLRTTDTVETGVRLVLDSELPALPVVDEHERFVGIFGEREFMGALYPGYVKQLRGTGFLSRLLDDALETRDEARDEPVGHHLTTDHVDVGPDFSDVQIAELFLHHRVLVIPVVDRGRIAGVITRRDFFRAIAERFVGDAPEAAGG
jgi:CBS-domain-containing membrane protein